MWKRKPSRKAVQLWIDAFRPLTFEQELERLGYIMRKVFTIIDPRKDGDKAFFQQVGVCFQNKDNSDNIILNALPCNGKLWIESLESAEKREEEKKEETGKNRRK